MMLGEINTVFYIHVRTVFVDIVNPFFGLPLVWYGWIEMCIIGTVSRIYQLALSGLTQCCYKAEFKSLIFNCCSNVSMQF